MLSAETLFHFTDSYEKLIGILQNNFHPRYSLERFCVSGGTGINLAFPMVCFCDIPLSQIKTHLDKYGCYGIGLSKEWASEKGLNPVLYLIPGTSLSDIIYLIIQELPEEEKDRGQFSNLRTGVVDLLRYIKLYKGDFEHNGKLYAEVKFYDEREWRYVPSLGKYKTHVYLTEKEFSNHDNKADANAKIEKAKLTFKPNDLRYLIVKEDSERIAMIEALRNIKSKYSKKTIDVMISRIMTCDQIGGDI